MTNASNQCGWALGSVIMALAAGAISPARTEQTNDRMDGLLLKVEHQITNGHISSPSDDNAMLTWEQVVQIAYRGEAEALEALASFAERERKQADAEKTAGKSELSGDLRLFSDLAHVLAASNSAREPPAGFKTRLNPVTASTITAPDRSNFEDLVPPRVRSSPTDSTIEPATNRGVALSSRSAATPPPSKSLAGNAKLASVYAKRGDDMLASRDISAARKFYEYAADAGSARAATALAQTYEPQFLARLGAIGLKPDLNVAALWYQRAAVLGDQNARERLVGLGELNEAVVRPADASHD